MHKAIVLGPSVCFLFGGAPSSLSNIMSAQVSCTGTCSSTSDDVQTPTDSSVATAATDDTKLEHDSP